MTRNNSPTAPIATLLETLTLIFVVLKLVHVIDWSWWWILAPTWIPILVLSPVIIYVLVLGIKQRHAK